MRLLFTLTLSLLFAFSAISQSKGLKLEKGIYAVMQTTKGDIVLKLHHEKAPLTVANFVGLAEGKFKAFDTINYKKPFYDSIVFHRVIANFMIQGGDPTASGSGGPGYRFWDETSPKDKFNKKGLLAMANSGPNTNGSQFFITHVPTQHLNGKHTIFGEVIEGQDVVDAIQQGDVLKSVKIIRKKVKLKPTKVFKAKYEELAEKVEKERLKAQKASAKNKVRVVEAKAKSEEEYKSYFYDIVKEIEPNAIQTESGLVYVVKEEGEGDFPVQGDHVSLHYLGEFIYGGKFDSSYDRNQPLAFDYLIMGLISGFNEGVGLSKKGAKIDLYIPYYLGYGKVGRGPSMPEYSDLIFRLEILDIKKKD